MVEEVEHLEEVEPLEEVELQEEVEVLKEAELYAWEVLEVCGVMEFQVVEDAFDHYRKV